MTKTTLAYVVGVALGDGNLSNPNGRATRLRITCDTKYPQLQQRIILAIQELMPKNKVSIVRGGKKSYCDISCYSNQWEQLLGWHVGAGSKIKQKIRIPGWIFSKKIYLKRCLKGLFETDGSIYLDRGYLMVNFVTAIPTLASDAMDAIS